MINLSENPVNAGRCDGEVAKGKKVWNRYKPLQRERFYPEIIIKLYFILYTHFKNSLRYTL